MHGCSIFFTVILEFLREGNIFPGTVFDLVLSHMTSPWICNNCFPWATWRRV